MDNQEVHKLFEDLAILTTIPENTLYKLLKKVAYCVCEIILEDLLSGKDFSAIDVGLGTLYIKLTDPTDVKVKFVFNKEMQKSIKNVMINKHNYLSNILNRSLVKKFTEVYKDLC